VNPSNREKVVLDEKNTSQKVGMLIMSSYCTLSALGYVPNGRLLGLADGDDVRVTARKWGNTSTD
jgi:hypothetical protein